MLLGDGGGMKFANDLNLDLPKGAKWLLKCVNSTSLRV